MTDGLSSRIYNSPVFHGQRDSNVWGRCQQHDKGWFQYWEMPGELSL